MRVAAAVGGLAEAAGTRDANLCGGANPSGLNEATYTGLVGQSQRPQRANLCGGANPSGLNEATYKGISRRHVLTLDK